MCSVFATIVFVILCAHATVYWRLHRHNTMPTVLLPGLFGGVELLMLLQKQLPLLLLEAEEVMVAVFPLTPCLAAVAI